MIDYYTQLMATKPKKKPVKAVYPKQLEAAMSPEQMTRQYSKPNPKLSGTNEMFSNLLYKRDELGVEDYNKMLRDPQIKSGYELIRMFLLSRKIIVNPSDDSEEAVDIADTLEQMLQDMDYPMRKVRNDMYSALIYGYSVSEIIWKATEDGNQIGIERIRPIPIDTIEDCFEYDDKGDVENIVQHVDNEEPIKIPAEKCLIYTYDECFGDREGKSILDGVYDNWYMKQKILGWYNVFLQKHEGPTLVGKAENPMYKDLFREQLDEIREGRANITVGMNDSVEVLESSHRGEGFKDAINYHDVMIYRKMNIGTMILGQEDGAGAYAQSQTQFDTLSIFLDGIHEDIAAELQGKINELIDMNWTVDDYPVVSFETFEEKDLLGLVNALKPLIDAGAIDAQDSWFRHLVADIVSRYSDVDVSELLDEEQQVKTEVPEVNVGEPNGMPTPEEQAGQTSQEQADLITQVQEQIKPKDGNVKAKDSIEAITGNNTAKPNNALYKAGNVIYTKKPILGKMADPYRINIKIPDCYQDLTINGKRYTIRMPKYNSVIRVWKSKTKAKWVVHYQQPTGFIKG